MPEWSLSDPDGRANLTAWLGEHTEGYEVVQPFMAYLVQKSPEEIEEIAEAIRAVAQLKRESVGD